MPQLSSKGAAIGLLVLGLVGVVDAAALTYDHQVASLGENSTICEPDGGCAAVRNSPMSRIPLGPERPALPISLLGVACYLVVVGLATMRLLKPAEPHSRRLLVGIGILATLYSAVLFVYSVVNVGKICPYCVVLYVVGAGVLVVSLWSLEEPVKDWLKNVWSSVFSRYGASAFAGFLVASIVGYNVYASPLAERRSSRLSAMMTEIKELPQQPQVSIDTDGRPFEGPKDAPVHIVKFADYECPVCGLMFEQLHRAVKETGVATRITMMNFPLSNLCNPRMQSPFHKNACLLAYAGECAHAQGKWDKIAGWLYANSRSVREEGVVEEAERLGMDREAFTACLKSPETDAQVKRDIEVGLKAGVSATPTFFVNGRKVVGGRPPQALDAMLRAFAPGGAP